MDRSRSVGEVKHRIAPCYTGVSERHYFAQRNSIRCGEVILAFGVTATAFCYDRTAEVPVTGRHVVKGKGLAVIRNDTSGIAMDGGGEIPTNMTGITALVTVGDKGMIRGRQFGQSWTALAKVSWTKNAMTGVIWGEICRGKPNLDLHCSSPSMPIVAPVYKCYPPHFSVTTYNTTWSATRRSYSAVKLLVVFVAILQTT